MSGQEMDVEQALDEWNLDRTSRCVVLGWEKGENDMFIYHDLDLS